MRKNSVIGASFMVQALAASISLTTAAPSGFRQVAPGRRTQSELLPEVALIQEEWSYWADNQTLATFVAYPDVMSELMEDEFNKVRTSDD